MHPTAHTGLADFPHDIHCMIFSYLPRSALKTLRLTSNRLNFAVEPLLFHSVFLKINIKSFKRLLSIANHDHLSQHVQTFMYDPRTLHSEHISGRRLPRSFDDWVERFAGNGRELFQYYNNCGYGSRKDFIASLSTSELEGFYKRYCEYKVDYDKIIKNPNKEKDMLAEIVPKFSNLKRILFFDPLEESDPIRKCGLKDFSWDDLSSVAKEILLDSGRPPSTNQDIRFWNLLIAASLLPRPSQLLSLQASCLSSNRWIQQVRFNSSYVEAFALLPNLENLSLQFSEEEGEPQGIQIVHLCEFLTCATNLKSLRLSFDGVTSTSVRRSSQTVGFPLHLFMASPSCPWSTLVHLSLQGVPTTEGELGELLLQHVKILRSLELCNIHFIPNKSTNELGCWIRFFQFLHSSLELTSLKLRGGFYNGAPEYWDCGSGDYPESCLRRRIERFCAREREAFPFTWVKKRKFEVKGKHVIGIGGVSECESPWMWDNDDDSWRFEPTSRVALFRGTHNIWYS
jgi:hypothetical protein